MARPHAGRWAAPLLAALAAACGGAADPGKAFEAAMERIRRNSGLEVLHAARTGKHPDPRGLLAELESAHAELRALSVLHPEHPYADDAAYIVLLVEQARRPDPRRWGEFLDRYPAAALEPRTGRAMGDLIPAALAGGALGLADQARIDYAQALAASGRCAEAAAGAGRISAALAGGSKVRRLAALPYMAAARCFERARRAGEARRVYEEAAAACPDSQDDFERLARLLK